MVWRQDKAAAVKMGILIKYYPISMFALVLRENKSHKNQHLKKFNSIQPKTFQTTQILRSQLLGSLKLFPKCFYVMVWIDFKKMSKKCDNTKSTIMMTASIIYFGTKAKRDRQFCWSYYVRQGKGALKVMSTKSFFHFMFYTLK